jgi:hypothetical protein
MGYNVFEVIKVGKKLDVLKDKKIEVFKKFLEVKEINVKKNHYLSFEKSKENSYVFSFGENVVAICDEDENKSFLSNCIFDRFCKSKVSFQIIANVMGIDIAEVELFFVSDILSNSGFVEKRNSTYYVVDDRFYSFIEGRMTLLDFSIKMANYLVENDMVEQLKLYRAMNIDGFKVYDIENDFYSDFIYEPFVI